MNFGALALMIAAGLVGPLLAAAPGRLGPPIVVGEIAAGMLIGSGGLGWVDPTDPVLTGLAAIGFALLMFVVGTHLPVRDRQLRTVVVVGLMITAAVCVVAVVAGEIMSHLVGLNRPAILAVLLATSSGAVGLPVLQGLDRADRPILVATAWIAIADVVTVLALPLVLANGRLGRVLLGSALVVLTGAVMLLVARATRGRTWARRLRTMSHDRGWGLDLRLSLLALFICAWLASRFGTSILIAGFTVGAAVALLGEPRRVAQQLVGLGEGFAIPLFFVHLGTRIDLGALFQSPRAMALAVTLGLVAILIHVAVGAASRVPVSMSLVASAQLGVPASVVSIGLATQQLTAAQGAAVMASLLITLAACALGSALLGHRGPLTDASAPH
jgi:Kef-type K+ transport system membrane component KefB